MTTAQPQFSTNANDFVGGGLPLRNFWCVLQDIVPNFGTDAKFVEFPCVDVEVLEADEGTVWIHPIAQITVRAFFDNQGRPQQYGDFWIVVESGQALGYPDIMSLKGQKIRWQCGFRPYDVKGEFNDDGSQKTAQAKQWRIAEVAGAISSSSNNVSQGELQVQLIELLAEPKNASDFSQAVLASPTLRGPYGGDQLFNGSLLSGLVAAGAITMENDLYQKV